MPEQAILDLPVIEFERYEDSFGRLHAQCIESYGLAGFRPHPDSVFHLAASLWRYRNHESMKQVAALGACYLHALSRQVASRRRVAAVRTAMQDSGDSAIRARLGQADEDLATAQDELNAISAQVSAYVSSSNELRKRSPAMAEVQLSDNLAIMGEPGWTNRLEVLARELALVDDVRINWMAKFSEVLEDLEQMPLVVPSNGNGNGHKPEASVIGRLKTELEQYRSIANRASTRLQQVDHERHELEALLEDSENQSSNRSLALEEAREALEVTLSDARTRLARIDQLETEHGAELKAARAEIQALRTERDRLAADLLKALESSTDVEVTQEELIERLESAVSERSEAAQMLSSLSRRLEEVQNEAVEAGDQADDLRAIVYDREDTLNELREELSHAEARNSQALATISALESDTERSDEVESILTESEQRLADTQDKLTDAELRIDQLGGQLEDKEYDLQRSQDRVEAQKKTIDSISVQLAESETLGDEHAARITALERENERLRRDLSDAQTKMLDASGDVDEARESARVAQTELERVKTTLDEERTKTTSASSESMALRKSVRDHEEELTQLKSELEDANQRLGRFEKTADESTRKARNLQDELATAQEDKASLEAERTRLQTELDAEKTSASSQLSKASELEQSSASLQSELDKARAEFEALQESVNRSGNQGAELRANTIELEQQVSALRHEFDSSTELNEDRTKKLNERIELAKLRAENAEAERASLQEVLQQNEKAREAERVEYEAIIERERKTVRNDEGALEQSSAQLEDLREKLNESEAFLIKRQREFERTDQQHKSMLDEVRAIADLRAKYEKLKPGKKRDEVASQIGRRMDSLFSTAGRPVHADRRTEKLVILTVKKTDEEIEEDSNKPFVATNSDADESNSEDPDVATSETTAETKKKKRTKQKKKKP